MRIGILATGIVATLLLTAPADAAFPGTNGRIALQGAQRIEPSTRPAATAGP